LLGPRPAVPVELAGVGGGVAEPFALTFDEHKQAWGEFVIWGDDEISGGSDDAACGEFRRA